VIHEGDAEIAALDPDRRPGAGGRVDPWAPWANFAVGHPFEGLAEAVFGNSRVEEPAIAKMFDDRKSFDLFGQSA
jgi:hypothetical protein